MSLTDVTRRARAGFDVERVTKRFYENFQKEHTAFLKFITGIPKARRPRMVCVRHAQPADVRLFHPAQGLSRRRPRLSSQPAQALPGEKGKDNFYSFYRYFLLRLFHEARTRSRTNARRLEKLIGRIPYLNGGIFESSLTRKANALRRDIQIPDKAFERIFDYFDQYQWHLDERPLRADNEINPDVLGYIFEKYINQKQMGAYYTKEDITEYIGKNTVLPFLFDAARKCKIAFDGPIRLDDLPENPDRYIYPAVRHGLSWAYIAEHPKRANLLKGARNPFRMPKEIDAGKAYLIERRKAGTNPRRRILRCPPKSGAKCRPSPALRRD